MEIKKNFPQRYEINVMILMSLLKLDTILFQDERKIQKYYDNSLMLVNQMTSHEILNAKNAIRDQDFNAI